MICISFPVTVAARKVSEKFLLEGFQFANLILKADLQKFSIILFVTDWKQSYKKNFLFRT